MEPCISRHPSDAGIVAPCRLSVTNLLMARPDYLWIADYLSIHHLTPPTGPVSGPPGTTMSTEGEGYADVFPLAARGPGSGSSAVCARCHAASRSRRSSATSVLAISRIASA